MYTCLYAFAVYFFHWRGSIFWDCNHWLVSHTTDAFRTKSCIIIIYIIISKNIRYLLWNRGARRLFHDTYLTIEVQGIRCTNHLHDSCPLTDVNPHFTAPGCRYYLKINSWWPVVTSSTHGLAASYCDVTTIHCSHGYLWTHDVEVDAHGANDGLAAVDGKLKLSKR